MVWYHSGLWAGRNGEDDRSKKRNVSLFSLLSNLTHMRPIEERTDGALCSLKIFFFQILISQESRPSSSISGMIPFQIMQQSRLFYLSTLVATLFLPLPVVGFQFPNIFGAKKPPTDDSSNTPTDTTSATKQALLQAISGTDNGKSATVERQAAVLKLVRELETTAPAPDTILTTDAALLDGPWFLQYTSPSVLGDQTDIDDAWEPVDAAEGNSKIPTKAFGGQGAVSAQGIKVETANRVVKQSIDVTNSRVKNEITVDWGDILVAGSFRPSTSVPQRAVVAFDTADLMLSSPKFKISLCWVFDLLALTKGGNKDNGWLETTYIDNDMRIGRGNKGTMFVLTRKADAVTA